MTKIFTSGHTKPGGKIIILSWAGTALFAVTATLSTLVESTRVVGVVVALVLFCLGCVAFLLAFFMAVQRSRTEEIGMGGLYFLAGSAPPFIVRMMMAALGVQLLVAFASASIRPFTSVAFGILVPMYGLGLAGLWAARYGTFSCRKKLRFKKSPSRRTGEMQ